MKIWIAFFLVAVSAGIYAEPYAEWARMGDEEHSVSMQEELEESGITMPDKTDIRIPAPNDSALTVNNPRPDGFCLLGLRTKLSVEQTCKFYRGHFPEEEGFERIFPDREGCYYFQGGEPWLEGVTVTPINGDMYAVNGSTQIQLRYRPLNNFSCQ